MMTKESEATNRWVVRLHDAMSALDELEMPERHRKTIWRCLSSELAEATDRLCELESTGNDGAKWTNEDLAQLQDFLNGKHAMSYPEGRIILQEISLKLHRSEKIVNKKAIELGLGRAIDWYANTR